MECENYMIKVIFVRHAQSEHDWKDDRTRPLTADGKMESQSVKNYLKDKKIDCFFSSPYQRSIDTIADSAAYFNKKIHIDERFRERENGPHGNSHKMFQMRWENHNFHEEGGESLAMVQNRNIAALTDILIENQNKNQDTCVVIGTHGTALSAI